MPAKAVQGLPPGDRPPLARITQQLIRQHKVLPQLLRIREWEKYGLRMLARPGALPGCRSTNPSTEGLFDQKSVDGICRLACCPGEGNSLSSCRDGVPWGTSKYGVIIAFPLWISMNCTS